MDGVGHTMKMILFKEVRSLTWSSFSTIQADLGCIINAEHEKQRKKKIDHVPPAVKFIMKMPHYCLVVSM